MGTICAGSLLCHCRRVRPVEGGRKNSNSTHRIHRSGRARAFTTPRRTRKILRPGPLATGSLSPKVESRCRPSFRPDVIVNAAAYTAVDRAETEQSAATQINAEALGILAEEAKRQQAILVHYSTDYVFDGSATLPYTETDGTGPINEYGKSKLAGEQKITQPGGAHFILRTSWVYSPRGSNFLLKVLQLGSERDMLRVVNDQIGSPTPASVVGDATQAVLQHCRSFEHARNLSGVYHASCRGQTSWFEFAQTIFAQAREIRLRGLTAREVVPTSTKEYPSSTQRPHYSVLCCRKIGETFSFRAPEWQHALTAVIRKVPQK